MKMRIKNLFFLNLILIFSIAGLSIYSGLKYQAFSVLEQTEKETLKAKNSLIIRTIQNEVDRLVALAKDWGLRDDSYFFMQDGSSDFIKKNLTQSHLNDVEITGLLFLNRNFKSYYAYSKNGIEVEFKKIVSQILANEGLFTESLRRGIHRIRLYNPDIKQHFWSVIHPISLADFPDQVNGYLVLIKLIDRDFVQKISRIIGTPIKLQNVENMSGFECLTEENIGEFCGKVYFVNDSKALLDISILDSDRKNRIFFHTETERSLNLKIRQVFQHTLFIVTATGILVILFNIWVVQRVVVRPISYLAQRFSSFARQRTVHQRLKGKGAFEIREMIHAANLMLNEIEDLNQQLTTQSRTDPLTQLFNRRYFDELLLRELGRATREKKPVSLLMLDVDYFKQYNDHYGHVAGDKCLEQIATILKTSLQRSSDIVARFGGEEFVLLLSNTSLPQMEQLVDNLSDKIKQAALPHEFSMAAHYVTCSIGGVSIVPDRNVSEQTLLLKADELLYQAKETGRNRAVLSDTLDP